jgi:hypothetical protein
MNGRAVLVLTVVSLCLCANLSGTIINVPAEYPTIQEGIDAAADEDTVLVAPGTYYENIDFNGKAILVTSNYLFDEDRSWIESTVIEGGDAIVVRFTSGEGRNSVISGFTLTHGSYCIFCDGTSPTIQYNRIVDNHVDHWGAGVSCWNGATPLINHNVISRNYASWGGAAVFAYYSAPVIVKNVMRFNRSQYGGAICSAWYSEAYIQENVIEHNLSTATGGGVHLSSMTPQVINNTIAFNTSPNGAGVYTVDYATSIITNNIIAFNSDGAGIMAYHGSVPQISYNDVYGNEGGDYEATSPGVGDISCDPLFNDPSHGDLGLTMHSPCIDAADPETDVPWYGGDRRDMGQREFSFLYPGQMLAFSGTPSQAEPGSQVAWDVSLTNPHNYPVSFHGWLEVSGPECSLLDPVFDLHLPAHGSYQGPVHVTIPEGLLPGSYLMKGRLGIIGEELWDGEVFDIELSAPLLTGK